MSSPDRCPGTDDFSTAASSETAVYCLRGKTMRDFIEKLVRANFRRGRM